MDKVKYRANPNAINDATGTSINKSNISPPYVVSSPQSTDYSPQTSEAGSNEGFPVSLRARLPIEESIGGQATEGSEAILLSTRKIASPLFRPAIIAKFESAGRASLLTVVPRNDTK
jgi:hypothetical protein